MTISAPTSSVSKARLTMRMSFVNSPACRPYGVEFAVAPGDLVYGDSDGVVAIPRAEHAELLERARSRAS